MNHRRVVAVLSFLIGLLVAAVAETETPPADLSQQVAVPQTHAIIVCGNDTSKLGFSQRGTLQGNFDRNAERVYEAFTNDLGLASVFTLHAERMSRQTFEGEISRIVTGIGPEDALIVYYTGHGLEGILNADFLPIDMDPIPGGLDAAYLDYVDISYVDFATLLDGERVRTLLLVDTCQSGSAIDALRERADWTLVTSCRADQKALLAGAFGSVFNMEFVHQLQQGRTRLDDILARMRMQYGEEPQVLGPLDIDLADLAG